MNYSKAFETISLYAPAVQTLFADGWERWPDEQAARRILPELDRAAKFWVDRDEEASANIVATISEITARAGLAG